MPSSCAALLLSQLTSITHLACSYAVGALESLALRDGDPRTRKACALPLASLCYAIKRSRGFSGTAGSGDAALGPSSSKGLQQLPTDGALRPLLESLLDGHWALPGVTLADASVAWQTCGGRKYCRPP